MSPSTKSKPASQSSPAIGDANEGSGPLRQEDPERAPLETVSIELETSKQRWIAWTIGGILGGILLIMKLGTVGVWAGYVLIALGLFRGYQLAMSLIHPAGRIVVSPKQVTLPRSIHRPRPLQVAPSEVTAVYFLRRSVPWNRSAPVLVIELGDTAMPYPRDWFPSEAEQRKVVHAIRGILPHARSEPEVAVEPAAAES